MIVGKTYIDNTREEIRYKLDPRPRVHIDKFKQHITPMCKSI